MDGNQGSGSTVRAGGVARAGWERLRAQFERITRRSDGEDLLQDAYVRMAMLSDAPRNSEAFLVNAACKRGRDTYRRERVRGERSGIEADALDFVADASPMQDEVLIARARLRHIQDGVARLSPRTREIFLLHRLDGLKYREIAEIAGISQSAVEKHIAKAATFLADWAEGW